MRMRMISRRRVQMTACSDGGCCGGCTHSSSTHLSHQLFKMTAACESAVTRTHQGSERFRSERHVPKLLTSMPVDCIIDMVQCAWFGGHSQLVARQGESVGHGRNQSTHCWLLMQWVRGRLRSTNPCTRCWLHGRARVWAVHGRNLNPLTVGRAHYAIPVVRDAHYGLQRQQHEKCH